MDFLGNRILTLVDQEPLDIAMWSDHFFQSGKLVFFEMNTNVKFAKLHVFDMQSVSEEYEKNGEVMCGSSDHESQASFKSRSISIEHRNFRYNDDNDEVSILTDKASVTLYVYDTTDMRMVARKSKFSFWNGKENPIFGDEDDDEDSPSGDGEIDADNGESD